MNMADIQAKRVKSFSQMVAPGDFMWSGRKDSSDKPTRLIFNCPCGCGSFPGVHVGGEPGNQPVWNWNGDMEKPTITPSIQIIGGCKLHGFLTNGVFKTC